MKKLAVVLIVLLVLTLCSCCCLWTLSLTIGFQLAVTPANSEQAWGQEENQLPTPVAQSQPPEQLQPTAIPTPVVRDRVLIFQGTSQTEYSKLQAAASGSGIEITAVTDRADFITELYQPDTALVIYPADSWNSAEDLQSIKRFIDGGGRALFLYNQRWGTLSETLQELYGVSIIGTEELVNTNGVYELHPVLPSFLSEFNTFTKGSSWILGGGYLETELEGEKLYLLNRLNGEDRLVYFQTTDRSLTFIQAIRAYEPRSDIFFDDAAIGYGDNQAAIIRLLEHLLER